MKRAVAVFTLLLAFATLAFAHGKEKHIMGTVTGIGGDSITLQTADKKSLTVSVSDKTKFEKSGAVATLKDLKVGNRVVVHAEQSGNRLTATQVRFGAARSQESMTEIKGMDHGAMQTHDHQ
jgi:Cu/Ag efflux protein CusF